MENSPNAGPTTESASVQDASNTIPRFSFLYSNPAYPARVYRVSLAYDGQAYTPRCRIEIRDAIATNCEHPFSAGPLTRDSLCAAVAVLPLIEDITGGDNGRTLADGQPGFTMGAMPQSRDIYDDRR
ncbi:hypothetical protein AB1286_21375 [Trinickia sp. NRRL B-1857]|uniref:hypothetical protein n=1 Tax=Trinickia sp. NRRL B-1857 TaxID=3162879 RepID=UPI003D2DF001